MSINREGFWKTDEQSALPHPVELSKPWRGRAKFLAMLASIEDPIVEAYAQRIKEVNERITSRLPIEVSEIDKKIEAYRGTSRCRICGCANGNKEFTVDGWQWPEGLRHYVEVHCVQPSAAFIEFIIQEELQ